MMHENMNPLDVSFNFYWGAIALSFITGLGYYIAKEQESKDEKKKAIREHNENIYRHNALSTTI